MSFLGIYFPFAAAYLLSYLFRSVNAVISPELTHELAVGPGALGLLTSGYFVAFAAMQIPLGMLLDRYGPRRVEPVMLVLAACGALGFALAEGLGGLVLARAAIGAGVAACLMAPLKAISAWYPAERQASLAGWMMVAGGLGALAATTPLELALRFAHWRTAFMVLAAATLLVAGWIAWRIPDTAHSAQAQGFATQWAGVKKVFAHPRFWWIAPLGGLAMGSFMAVQGLWSMPWLMEVEGMPRAEAARVLFAMGAAILGGYFLLGFFATRLARAGIHARHLFAAGFTLNALALAAIVGRLPGGALWWVLYGLGASVNVLAFSVLNEGFGKDLAGRANTAANLMMFAGSFASQWGIGVVVDLAASGLGLATADGLRLAFSIVLALHLATLAWFARGWRNHAVHREPALRAAH